MCFTRPTTVRQTLSAARVLMSARAATACVPHGLLNTLPSVTSSTRCVLPAVCLEAFPGRTQCICVLQSVRILAALLLQILQCAHRFNAPAPAKDHAAKQRCTHMPPIFSHASGYAPRPRSLRDVRGDRAGAAGEQARCGHYDLQQQAIVPCLACRIHSVNWTRLLGCCATHNAIRQRQRHANRGQSATKHQGRRFV